MANVVNPQDIRAQRALVFSYLTSVSPEEGIAFLHQTPVVVPCSCPRQQCAVRRLQAPNPPRTVLVIPAPPPRAPQQQHGQRRCLCFLLDHLNDEDLPPFRAWDLRSLRRRSRRIQRRTRNWTDSSVRLVRRQMDRISWGTRNFTDSSVRLVRRQIDQMSRGTRKITDASIRLVRTQRDRVIRWTRRVQRSVLRRILVLSALMGLGGLLCLKPSLVQHYITPSVFEGPVAYLNKIFRYKLGHSNTSVTVNNVPFSTLVDLAYRLGVHPTWNATLTLSTQLGSQGQEMSAIKSALDGVFLASRILGSELRRAGEIASSKLETQVREFVNLGSRILLEYDTVRFYLVHVSRSLEQIQEGGLLVLDGDRHQLLLDNAGRAAASLGRLVNDTYNDIRFSRDACESLQKFESLRVLDLPPGLEAVDAFPQSFQVFLAGLSVPLNGQAGFGVRVQDAERVCNNISLNLERIAGNLINVHQIWLSLVQYLESGRLALEPGPSLTPVIQTLQWISAQMEEPSCKIRLIVTLRRKMRDGSVMPPASDLDHCSPHLLYLSPYATGRGTCYENTYSVFSNNSKSLSGTKLGDFEDQG